MLTDRYFMPDRCFDDIYMITPEFLLAEGIRAVLLDIDNIPCYLRRPGADGAGHKMAEFPCGKRPFGGVHL